MKSGTNSEDVELAHFCVCKRAVAEGKKLYTPQTGLQCGKIHPFIGRIDAVVIQCNRTNSISVRQNPSKIAKDVEERLSLNKKVIGKKDHFH
jgi:hypothetical protein